MSGPQCEHWDHCDCEQCMADCAAGFPPAVKDAARAAAPPVEPQWECVVCHRDVAESARVAHEMANPGHGWSSPDPVAGLRTRAIGRLNDYLSTLPVSPGRSQALVDLNVILTEERAALRAAARPAPVAGLREAVRQIEDLTSYHPHEAPYVGGDASLPCHPTQCAGGMKAQVLAILRPLLDSAKPELDDAK